MDKSEKNEACDPAIEAERPLSAKENMLWNSAGNFIYLVSQWLLSYAVVRILGYDSAGIFSLAMSIGTSCSTIALYSMRNYQVSDVANEYSAKTYLFSRHATCGLSIVACLAFTLANGYDEYTTVCIMAFMIFKASEALSDVFQGIMQKKMRMDYIGISFAIKGVLELVVFVGLLLLIGDLLAAIAALAIISYAIIFVYDRRMALRNVVIGTSSKQYVTSLLIACLPLAAYGFLFNTAAQLPRYYVEGLLGTEQLGYYATVAMPVVVVQVAANYVFSPLMTPMAQYLHSNEVRQFMSLFNKTLLAIAVIAVVSFAGFTLLGEWFLVFLFGDSIAPYAYLLGPLVICATLTALAWFLAAILTLVRKLKSLLAFSVAMFAIVAFGSTPSIVAFGLNGANFILAIALAIFIVACAATIYQTFAHAGSNHSSSE